MPRYSAIAFPGVVSFYSGWVHDQVAVTARPIDGELLTVRLYSTTTEPETPTMEYRRLS